MHWLYPLIWGVKVEYKQLYTTSCWPKHLATNYVVQRLQKKPYTASPQEVIILGNEYIKQRNCFSLTMNILNFANWAMGKQYSSASDQWLAWHAATVSASSLANQLAFSLSKEFPFSSTIYNCEAVQCLATKSVVKPGYIKPLTNKVS